MNSKRIFIMLLNIHAISSMDTREDQRPENTMNVDTFDFSTLEDAILNIPKSPSASAPTSHHVTPQKQFSCIDQNTPENTSPNDSCRPSCLTVQKKDTLDNKRTKQWSPEEHFSHLPSYFNRLQPRIQAPKCKKDLFPNRNKRKSADSSDDEE